MVLEEISRRGFLVVRLETVLGKGRMASVV